jgi:hypothetical protein
MQLPPDLPNEEAGEQRRKRASEAREKVENEQVLADMGELMRVFLETKALL